MDKYLHYTSTELAQEPSFIYWAKGEVTKPHDDWQQWILDHPQMKDKVAEAKRLVAAINFAKDIPKIGLEDKLWQNIIDQTSKKSHKSRTKLIKFISYGAAAAIAIFVLFTTCLLYTSPSPRDS